MASEPRLRLRKGGAVETEGDVMRRGEVEHEGRWDEGAWRYLDQPAQGGTDPAAKVARSTLDLRCTLRGGADCAGFGLVRATSRMTHRLLIFPYDGRWAQPSVQDFAKIIGRRCWFNAGRRLGEVGTLHELLHCGTFW